MQLYEALAQQHQCDVRHVREIADRSLGGDFGNAVGAQQRKQPLDHARSHTGDPVREVVDGGGDDRPHFTPSERRPHSHSMAHDDVARQLAQLRWFHDDIRESADAGVDSVGADPPGDDGFDQPARVRDAPE